MASTPLDETITDSRGDVLPATSLGGGVKLPASSVVFRNEASADVPASATDPFPVAGEMTLDADQQDAQLGQLTAILDAIVGLGDAISTGATTALIAVDSDDYPGIASPPGSSFTNLRDCLHAIDAHMAAFAITWLTGSSAQVPRHYIDRGRVYLTGIAFVADVVSDNVAGTLDSSAQPASYKQIPTILINDALGTPRSLTGYVVIGLDGSLTLTSDSLDGPLLGQVEALCDGMSYQLEDPT